MNEQQTKETGESEKATKLLTPAEAEKRIHVGGWGIDNWREGNLTLSGNHLIFTGKYAGDDWTRCLRLASDLKINGEPKFVLTPLLGI